MEDQIKIKEMTENGFAIKRIAVKLNKTTQEVKTVITNNGYTLKKEEFNDSLIPHIVSLYESGVSAKNLGKKYSIDKRRVQKWARKNGVERSRNEAHRFTKFNEQFFDEIDTPEKAYWLGFFYADAYNCEQTNTIHVTLSNKDKNHLKKLAKAINLPTHNIKTYNSKIEDKEYPTCTLRFYSKHMCNSLKEKGCPQAKSFILTYPNWLNRDLHNHFIRGMFDGDGCLCKKISNNEWKWSLVSTKECCEKIQEIISKNLDLFIKYHCISKTNNNTYELETSGNEKINQIMKWIYEDSTSIIRLDRKYKKYEELVNQQNNRKFSRDNYKIKEETINEVIKDLDKGGSFANVGKKHNIHPRTVSKIKNNSNDFSKVVEINGQLLTAKFFKPLTKDEREVFVEPLFQHFRSQGWIYPTIPNQKLRKDWKKLCNHKPNLENNEVFNNSSMATSICRHFCKSFCHATERGKRTMLDLWEDDEFLYKLIRNRLVINWNSSVNETFNISHRMMIQGMRSMRAVPSTSMFKPSVAKYVCSKYSNPGDLVGDYSAGFGGRMLGAVSCGRKYQATDPLTVPELEEIAKFFDFSESVNLIHQGSEVFKGEENSLDLCWSSPPYYDQEYYSEDLTQAYNQGEEYFYEVYWKKTLENCKFMLKPGKWFGLNVKNYPRMLKMAEDLFGEVKEKVILKTIRSHLNKSAGVHKHEYIYMFINNK